MSDSCKKGTIDSTREQMEHLSMSPSGRTETPPRIQRSFPSAPSMVDVSPSSTPRENSSPVSMGAGQHQQPPVSRHHELTPVMRNTTTDYVDEKNVVSPDDHDNLALPSAASLRSSRPPLRRRSIPSLKPIPLGARTKSLTHVEEAKNEDASTEEEDVEDVGGAVEFPVRHKFYSFNSRHSYDKQMDTKKVPLPMVTIPASAESRCRLTPYQPSREGLGDLGALPPEELNSIFIQREDLTQAIPLGERQWSIPSIRMANHLNGSTTDYTDDEDCLNDDASWSSRGSSLFIPEDDEGQPVLKFPVATSSSLTPTNQPVVIVEGDLPDIVARTDSEESVNAVAAAGRKRKPTYDEVFAWLRTVEQEKDVAIAEAASSKFLTQGGQVVKNKAFSRQLSSPAAVDD